MLYHKENLLHLLKLLVILFLWYFGMFPLYSTRDVKANGDILKIIHYLKQVFRGQSLKSDELHTRYLLVTAPWGLHQDKHTNWKVLVPRFEKRFDLGYQNFVRPLWLTLQYITEISCESPKEEGWEDMEDSCVGLEWSSSQTFLSCVDLTSSLSQMV